MSSTSRRTCVDGWSVPRRLARTGPSSSAGSVTSTGSDASLASSSFRRAANACSIASRAAFNAIPDSRSRTSRSASFRSDLRPRYLTRSSCSSPVVDAASTAASASRWRASASTAATVSELRHTIPVSVYDSIARVYDPWSTAVIEDISFYVEEALGAGGFVVELGVGTGRIAIPTAMAGVHMIGVDSSPGMLEVCAEHAREAGVAERLDLRLGDLRRPPVDERVKLVTCPFRAYLHLASDEERLEALGSARTLLRRGGRLVFDVFAPLSDDMVETH